MKRADFEARQASDTAAAAQQTARLLGLCSECGVDLPDPRVNPCGKCATGDTARIDAERAAADLAAADRAWPDEGGKR